MSGNQGDMDIGMVMVPLVSLTFWEWLSLGQDFKTELDRSPIGSIYGPYLPTFIVDFLW